MTVTTRPRSVETAVIGAGQAGLAMSWYLRQGGREHVVLERRKTLGGGWQDRWDEFCLVTPNWSTSMPGYPYDGDDPDGFMPRDAIAARIAGYAAAIDAPVELGTSVDRLSAADHAGFLLETSAGPLAARRVVVAAGAFNRPKVPALAAELSARIFQIHSHQYRKPADLPPGGVLIVGSGQSGVQLAEELQAAGRRVYLSVGSAGRVPRRYRGRDVFWWLAQLCRHDAERSPLLPTVGMLPDPRMRFAANPQLSGHGGGHETNLRRMAADGITLLGRLEGVDGERVRLGDDLPANLAAADRFFDNRWRAAFDAYIEREGLDAPPDDREPFDFEPPAPAELDLNEAGITSVLWTSGYKLDFGWLDMPILDEWGVPRHDRGVSDVPGLYFLGLPWQYTQLSPALPGVGWDAAHLARHMGLPVA